MLKNGFVIAAGLAVAATLSIAPAAGQSCGGTYVVKKQDTLSGISKRAYGLPRRWRIIYNANYKLIGTNPTFIFPGQNLFIPCRKGKAPKLQLVRKKRKQVISPAVAKVVRQTVSPAKATLVKAPPPATLSASLPAITLLTAGDYKPFTDKKLPRGGMIAELVATAMDVERKSVSGPQGKIVWVNDWSAHLSPLLVNKAFDLGFPWFKPDCARYDDLDKPAKFRCDNFYFSKPVFEILVVFFKKKGSAFQFTGDKDVIGSRLCRPAGYFTFDLDKDGRNWIKDKKVTLAQPQSLDECFQMLDKGEVDAVALNEFTGKAAVQKLQMGDRVETLERPVSILNLHVIVAKTHKRAKALLAYVNDGLARIRADGLYGEIVDRHLTRFWSGQGNS
jgi:polar amino acid transport system substrate-binding protein